MVLLFILFFEAPDNHISLNCMVFFEKFNCSGIECYSSPSASQQARWRWSLISCDQANLVMTAHIVSPLAELHTWLVLHMFILIATYIVFTKMMLRCDLGLKQKVSVCTEKLPTRARMGIWCQCKANSCLWGNDFSFLISCKATTKSLLN
jgi:hypothetical protein